MQESLSKNTLVPQAWSMPFYLGCGFLIAIILWSVWLFFYNISQENAIENLKITIDKSQKEIALVSRDRNVIIAKIESSNTLRPSIDLKWIVNDFYDAATRANVRLKGFSIGNDIISTALIATEPEGIWHPDPASTIIKMMRDYVRPNWRFSLEPITAISWDTSSRTTAIQFKVVPLPIQ